MKIFLCIVITTGAVTGYVYNGVVGLIVGMAVSAAVSIIVIGLAFNKLKKEEL